MRFLCLVYFEPETLTALSPTKLKKQLWIATPWPSATAGA
jgi:hypothetical protein